MKIGAIVRYNHPSWGPSRGRVLALDGRPGFVLVQDLAPNGAREWWPVTEIEESDDPTDEVTVPPLPLYEP